MLKTNPLEAGFKGLTIYSFNKRVLFDEGGLETEEFICDDIPGSFTSERSCLEAILIWNAIIVDFSLHSDYSLEDICLRNDVFAEFIDN